MGTAPTLLAAPMAGFAHFISTFPARYHGATSTFFYRKLHIPDTCSPDHPSYSLPRSDNNTDTHHTLPDSLFHPFFHHNSKQFLSGHIQILLCLQHCFETSSIIFRLSAASTISFLWIIFNSYLIAFIVLFLSPDSFSHGLSAVIPTGNTKKSL
mgnify:CR=1 FL=1